MADRIKVIIKRPGEQIGHMTHIANTVESFQNHVGGYYEEIHIGSNEVMIVNEEGKLRGLPKNFRVGINFPDFIRGTAIICGKSGSGYSDVPFDLHFWQTLLTKWKN